MGAASNPFSTLDIFIYKDCRAYWLEAEKEAANAATSSWQEQLEKKHYYQIDHSSWIEDLGIQLLLLILATITIIQEIQKDKLRQKRRERR